MRGVIVQIFLIKLNGNKKVSKKHKKSNQNKTNLGESRLFFTSWTNVTLIKQSIILIFSSLKYVQGLHEQSVSNSDVAQKLMLAFKHLK